MPDAHFRRPTMRDVADAAGVSLKTVSRVVNREEGVSSDLVQRVDAAIERLRYVPDERARTLRLLDARPSSIGLVLSDVANPFFSAVLRGLEDVAQSHRCFVLSASSDNHDDRQEDLIQSMIQRRVSGLVVVSPNDHPRSLSADDLRGTPLVFLDCEPTHHDYDSVRTDHLQAAVSMTRHLIAHGHRHIGFLGDDPDIFSARLRLQGFLQAMSEAGLDVQDDWIVTGRRTPLQWATTATQWLSNLPERPTAVVTAQNFVTIGMVRALHQLGLQRAVALVGMDDLELGDVVEPGISVLPQHPFDLGRRAGELLFRRLDGETHSPARELLLSAIIMRGSGEIAPTR